MKKYYRSNTKIIKYERIKMEVTMKKSKPIDLSSYFEDDLFNKSDIEYISEKVEANYSILLGVTKYLEIERKANKLNLQLSATLNSQQEQMLKQYWDLEVESIAYHNCLAYYLGLKSRIDIDKLK